VKQSCAGFIVRSAWAWIVGWAVVAAGVWLPAPRIPTLLQDDATGCLPADMPSQRAWSRLAAEFPEAAPRSRAAVIFAHVSGLTADDRAYVGDLARRLNARSAELNWRIRAVETAPYLQPLLESSDGEAAIIVVDLPAEMLTHSSVRRVREIKQELSAVPAPPGLQVEVTGNAAMGELLDAKAKHDIDRTTLWAFVAVTAILLVIYRSPIAMLLPLITIAASLMVALGSVGWAASFGWPINGLVEMFIIVLVVGSGVDYCLFLFARFREELSSTGGDATRAVEAALTHSAPAILAAAGTVAVGLATLFLARNRDLYTSGPTIAFAIGVAALAVLTLTPSLMRVVGLRLISLRRGSRFPEPKEGAFWRAAARIATRFPLGVTAAMIAVLLPTSIVGARVQSLYDTVQEYPAESSFVRGAQLYSRHFFNSGSVTDMTLIVSTDVRLDEAAGLAALRTGLDQLYKALNERFPIAYQRDLQDPLGSARSRPGSVAANVRSLLADGFGERLVREAYIGRSGTATRIELGVRVELRTITSMQPVDQARSVVAQTIEQSGLLKAIGAAHVAVDVAGESAAYADMRQLRTRDFRVIAVAACTLIYLILVGLIRSPMQAVILLTATLLTYLATYGATYLIVHATYGLNGLSWQINFLLFIIIMSLGQDYNIFVVARIHEELRTHPPREAIEIAIRKTGRVVSGCGIIMAATFASMFSGSLLVLKEFAIALPLGILIDTFVVRPLLVPAMILLVYEWTAARRGHVPGTASAAAAD
jgi:RND superfamily putative drug exporter